jgi:signal transduction histidine kinase
MLSLRHWFLNRSLATKLVLVLSIPVLFLVIVSVETLLVFEEFEAAELLVERSNQIRAQAVYNLKLLYSIQNGFRGYLLTGDRSILAPYEESKGDLDLAGRELARLLQDSPSEAQRDRVANVLAITQKFIQEKDLIIARIESGHRDEGISYIKSGRGRELAAAISSLLTEIEEGAAGILEAREENLSHKRAILLNIIIGGTLLTLLLTGLGAVVVARSVTKPMASLAQAAVEIGQSSYAVFPDTDRDDEVGVLSRSMEEMQRRLVPAERLAALTRIATSIAHDLRTPLVGLERGLQGLQYTADSHFDPEMQRLLGDLHTGARLATGVVQDILDLYRQAYGELPLSYSRFMLGDVIREVMDLMKSEIQDRRLSVSIEGPPVEVSADQRRMSRVMVNLLDNAVKNSPAGGRVRIIVSVRGEGPEGRAIVTVEDEGRGLDPTTLDALFEPDRPALAPTRGGTGLGLYLCRLVIGAHRGTIGAQNRPGGGARFVFEIPVEVQHVDPTADRGRPASVQAEPAHRP